MTSFAEREPRTGRDEREPHGHREGAGGARRLTLSDTIARALAPHAYPAALAGIDFARLAAELDGAFRAHGARTQASPADLQFHSRGLAQIASFVLESDTVARAVVTHVRVAPFFAGIALTVHPKPELDAPLLLADLMVAPPGSSRAFLDACGPAIGRPSFAKRFREPLASVVDGVTGLHRSTPPAWIAPLSGGSGARLWAPRGKGGALARIFVGYVERYLDGLASAEPSADPASNVAAARTVRDVVRAHGPSGKYLARSFGEAFTSRYLRLLWRDE